MVTCVLLGFVGGLSRAADSNQRKGGISFH